MCGLGVRAHPQKQEGLISTLGIDNRMAKKKPALEKAGFFMTETCISKLRASQSFQPNMQLHLVH